MPNRRHFLAAAAGAPLLAVPPSARAATKASAPVRYCLNTSTIRGQGLSLGDEVRLVADAGYDGIEPWVREIVAHREAGHSVADLGKEIADRGLAVESAIGFAKWVVNDDQERAAGLKQMREDMLLLKSIGGTRIAAPPVGMQGQDAPPLDLDAAAERYAAVLALGRETGVTPQLEVWGFSKNLSKLSEVLYVAAAAGDRDACVLPDIYHFFRGGTSFEAVGLLAGTRVHCFHLNDVPIVAEKALSDYADADRVYPGQGDAPVAEVMQEMINAGFRGAVSLELFNRDYWTQDAATVLKRGLESMRSVVG